MIKKIIINGIVLVVITALYFTRVINVISIKDVLPDFLLILTIFNGIFISPTFGIIFGFSAGILYDVQTLSIIGINSIIYSTVGYLTFIPIKRVEIDNSIISSIIVFIFIIVKLIIFLILSAIFRDNSEIALYFKNVFVIETIYTLVISIPIFYIYKKLFRKTKNRISF
ncbi:MAG TPA: rod shape-determining protein MreD [Spirochaetota bacterium]|jgi:rod shape-determining protein MreD|nr:MAG: rod shape-determining protein MreD [Spirochaetes bacterium ADurb.Bin133]HNZ25871.1 rod shape-determining protein MreD [Spirochaetota bacterium]HPY88513.1 rod shape-determining protein MreD [Spirochaetota bacterium]